MKYPIYKQDTMYSCGAYCMQMILKYHHIQEEIREIKKHCKLTPNGSSVYGLIECFKHYNIEAKAYQCDFTTLLQEAKLPCIIHTYVDDLAHYMVLYKAHKEYLTIGDPAVGLVKMNTNEVEKIFSGACIVIEHVGRLKKKTTYHNFYPFVFKHIYQNYQQIIKLVGYSMIITITSVLGSFYFQIIIDTIKVENYWFVLGISAAFIGLAAIKSGMMYFRKRFITKLQSWINSEYVYKTMQNIMYLPFSYLRLQQEGVLLTKVQNLYQLSDFFVHLYSALFMDSILLLGLVIALVAIDMRIAFFVIATMVGIVGVCYMYLTKIIDMNKAVIEKNENMQQTILEYLANIFSVHQYQLRTFMKNKLYFHFDEYQNAIIKKENQLNVLQSLVESILQGLSFVIILCSCLFYKQGNMSLGSIMLLYMLTSHMIEPLLNTVSLFLEKEEIKIIFERYKEIIPSKKVKKKIVKERITNITVDYISYSYGYTKPIFEHVDLEITKSIWLQGDTGSGKSTLLQLLMGYDLPVKGDIKINGYRIQDLDLQSVYQKMYYLDKNPIFFQETLRFNLLGNALVHEERMLALLQLFDMEELINRLEEGIDKDGGFLSSGQQQIVMLIRAILKKPEVLILDEAIGNIDAKRVRKILLYIENFLKDTIVIIVLHQTNIVNVNYDCVIIEKGNIITKRSMYGDRSIST